MTNCVNDGLLPLKVKGFKIATSLQNPYISTLDLKGISYRVFFIFFKYFRINQKVKSEKNC